MERPAEPSARVHLRDELTWSFVATLFLTAMMRLAQAAGVTRMDIPLMLGTMITPDRDRAKMMGFIAHMLNGWMLGSIYTFAFHSLRRSSPLLGAAIGLVHGLFVLIVAIPLMPGIHPRMASDFTGPEPTARLEPPGFMAMNYGRRTPVITLLAHMVYGAILGHFYEVEPGGRRRGLLRRGPAAALDDVAALRMRNR
jgi:hypothetical protein